MTVNLINPLQKAAFSTISITRPASGKDEPEGQALKSRRDNCIIHAFHGPKREIPAATNSFLLRKGTNVLPQSDETPSAKQSLPVRKSQNREASCTLFPPNETPRRDKPQLQKDSLSLSGLTRKPASCASHAQPTVKKKGILRKECHSAHSALLEYGGILHRPPRRDGIRDSRAPPVTF